MPTEQIIEPCPSTGMHVIRTQNGKVTARDGPRPEQFEVLPVQH